MVCSCALAAATPAWSDLAQDLEAVKDQRSQLEEVFHQRLRDCDQKFNVTACRQQALTEKSQAMAPLVEQQRALQAQMRADKARERRTKILEKQSPP